MEPKTFVLKRTQGQFEGGLVTDPIVIYQGIDCDVIEVTIVPRKPVRERRREALLEFGARVALKDPAPGAMEQALNALEAIDRGE